MGFVLTDGATFQCAHMVAPVGIAGGITISSVATRLTIVGTHPIVAGATIGGFTSALCKYQTSGSSTPCVSFVLTPPAEAKLVVDGKTVFTTSDLPAIKSILSTGNGIPGLTIVEPETRLNTA